MMTELFFKHRPNVEGALKEDEVFKLNRTLARLYDEHADDAAGAPPPEPLPAGTMRYPAFRTNVHRALARLCEDSHEKEKVLTYLIGQAQVPDEPKALVLPEGAGLAMPVEELEINVLDDAPVTVSCWGPPVLTAEQRERLQRYIDVVNEAKNHEATQKTLLVAKTWGSLAIQSSKQVLDTARVYGMNALVGAQSFSKQLRAADEEYCTSHPGRRPVVQQACQNGENQHCPEQQLEQQQYEVEGGLQFCVEQEQVLNHITEDAPPRTAPASRAEPHGHVEQQPRLPLPPQTTVQLQQLEPLSPMLPQRLPRQVLWRNTRAPRRLQILLWLRWNLEWLT